MEYKEAFRKLDEVSCFLISEENWDELSKSQQAILATKAKRLYELAVHRIVNNHSGMQVMQVEK